MACSMPPMYWSTGMKWATLATSKGAAPLPASQKRRKYHDESTKVSIVSVSRVAGGEELHVVGEQDGKLGLGHRPGPVLRAVDDGDGTAPVALPGDEPVPQPVVDLGFPQPTLGQPGGGGRLGLLDRH